MPTSPPSRLSWRSSLSLLPRQWQRRRPSAPFAPQLPRAEVHHDPENDHCPYGCQLRRIGEEISEKLDYTPGVLHVERHTLGKWICDQCEALIQASTPAQIIDKGIPTAGLLAQVLIAKYADHLLLYR